MKNKPSHWDFYRQAGIDTRQERKRAKWLREDSETDFGKFWVPSDDKPERKYRKSKNPNLNMIEEPYYI